jgi:hypothetical protein
MSPLRKQGSRNVAAQVDSCFRRNDMSVGLAAFLSVQMFLRLPREKVAVEAGFLCNLDGCGVSVLWKPKTEF